MKDNFEVKRWNTPKTVSDSLKHKIMQFLRGSFFLIRQLEGLPWCNADIIVVLLVSMCLKCIFLKI